MSRGRWLVAMLTSRRFVFATPDAKRTGKPIENGTVFRLHSEPKKEWLEWSPAIDLPSKVEPGHWGR